MSTTYTKGQTWAALKKCWRGFRIAKVKNDRDRMVEFAKRIRTLQQQLGLAQAKFPELGLE